LVSSLDDFNTCLDLLDEDPDDTDLLTEAQSLKTDLQRHIDTLELTALLSGKYDTYDCVFSIFAGAGGTDAQDWVQMLLRMYTRWFEKKGYTVTILEETMGDEAGIKSVTAVVSGDYAYGYLKAENGVHRLVRLSPFNANNKRQTSFAAVDIIPKIEHATTDIKIDTKELKIDTFRASGAGGQHVNKTDSAVRVTHLPTGIVATSQSSRSQGDNKSEAMGVLMSKLVRLMEKEHKAHVNDLRGTVTENAWGNQIRSYVFHPYKLVKDLRTTVETSNLQSVMDGDLDLFIESNLRNVS
jgi:peptide chain release factor 2